MPVEFAEIHLFINDNISIKQTLTDSLGSFRLQVEKGDYILKVKHFGQEYFSQNIKLSQDKDLGKISIRKMIELEGVSIQARKKLIEQKVDRLVYNVENSIASQGMSGLDALRSTPLINVLNDNIAIAGKGGVAIMINDRMLNLSGSELTNYLQSIRSDDIAKIEVITTPPSKYEAQGNSGIINIILKKNPNLGWSGSVNASYNKNTYGGFRTGATVNYQSNKISTSLKIRQYDLAYKTLGTRNLLGSINSIYTSENRRSSPNGLGLNYSLDYKIDNKQNLGFIYDFGNQYYNMNAEGISRYERNLVVDSTLVTQQKQRWITPTHTLNIYYDLKLDSIGKKLSIIGNYMNNGPDKINDLNTLSSVNQDISVIRNNSKMKYSVLSAQGDLTLPYKWINIDAGIKYTSLDNKSDIGYYDFDGTDYILNPNNSNVFRYKEHNYAIYVGGQKDFGKKWSAKVGLRYEYTSLGRGGISQTRSNYGKIFPTAYVSFKPNDHNSFTLNYSKRINRPDFQSLNPFRWYTNPYMYYTGNPSLIPSYNDNVELNYSYRGKLTFGLYNQYSRNNISNIARFTNGIYSNTFENGYDQNIIGINISYYNTFFKIWETSVNINGSYTTTKPIIPELEKLKVYSMSYSFYNTIRLNKNKTWFLLLNIWQSLPYAYANIKLEDQFEFSPGVKASFFDKKLQANLVISDLFKTIKNNGYSYNGEYRSEFNQYNDHRGVKLSLTYSFGNNKVKGANKTIKFEEQSRAN
ncbi:TonB-dependent receptor domain-containing protein [Elizabethkingia anophelis]